MLIVHNRRLLSAEAVAAIPLDDARHPGLLGSDGIVEVCPGALIAAHAAVIAGSVSLQAEVGQRGGPWTAFVKADHEIPMHVVPDDAAAVRVVAVAGADGAELTGTLGPMRTTYVTVDRSCPEEVSSEPEEPPRTFAAGFGPRLPR